MATLIALLFAVTFEAHSPNYALEVTSGDTAIVVLTDLQTHAVLISEEVAWTGPSAEIARDFGDRHITVHISRNAQFITATAQVEHGDMLVDSIHGGWMVAPRRAHVQLDGAMRIGGNVHAPKLVERVEPKYTAEARKARLSGIVIVEARIDETGRVTDAMAVKPLPFGLSEAALDAVKQWRFEPGMLDGKPVPVVFNVTVNFKLDSAPAPPTPY